MDCSEFLDSYSDFRDGVITDPQRLRLLRDHYARCLSCSRYDASVRNGIRAFGEIEPSADFRERLRARIAATAGQPMEPVGPGAAGIAAGLMLAAAVALLIYEGSRRPGELPLPVATAAPGPVTEFVADRPSPVRPIPPFVVVNPSMPFLSFTDLSVSPFHTAGSFQFHVQSDIPLGAWTNLPR
jgi:hypothetical protein